MFDGYFTYLCEMAWKLLIVIKKSDKEKEIQTAAKKGLRMDLFGPLLGSED